MAERLARRGLSTGVLILLLAAVLITQLVSQNEPADADHQPADKVFAAADTLDEIGPGANVTILTGTVRTSSPSDLILSVTLECSIFTKLITDTTAVNKSAQGRVDVEVRIDNAAVPVSTDAGGPSSVTFCNRVYSRTVTNQESDNAVDKEEDFIDTKASNAFNWVALNLGSGIHTIEVKATLTVVETGAGSDAEAIVGRRTLVVQPAKLANDAAIT